MTIANAAPDVKKGFPNLDAGTPGDVPGIDALAINTIRTLSMDGVQAANSGHPGTPMALAPVAYALWQRVLNFAVPGATVNRDSTDFVKPLSDIYSLINRDIAENRIAQGNDETRARYSVIFLSDGQPTRNQDDELLCGDAVRRIRQLKDLADDVKVNTVHVFTVMPAHRLDRVRLRRRHHGAGGRQQLHHPRPAPGLVPAAHRQPERRSPLAHGRPGRW